MSEREKYIQALPFSALIDVGCGTGETVVELAGLCPKAHFVGIDINNDVLSKAQEMLYDGLLTVDADYVCGNCLNMPIASNSADAIMFRAFLHHIEQIDCVFEEAHRILRRNGFLLIQDGEEMPALLFDEMNMALSRSGASKEVHPGFNIDKLTEQLKKYSFVTETVIREGVATFATPPFVSKVYSTISFLLSARKI